MRNITGMRALVYTKYASKSLQTNLATPEEKRKYFEAIRTLRNLADKYGRIHGIDMDSLNERIIK